MLMQGKPTLIVWGKNDPFFGPEGAKAFEHRAVS